MRTGRPPGSGAKYPPEVVELARSMRDDGMAYREIARRLNVPFWTLVDWLTYRGRA